MRGLRAAVAATTVLAALGTLTACGGGQSGDNSAPRTLTYWASNQGPDVQADRRILGPELAKFQKQTGIKVKLEVVPWSDLLNRILAAATSGQGPDVLNIGNTWSASLQATGALVPWDATMFAKIGGKSRFIAPALGSTGAAGKAPTAVPLYSMDYALYYNKKMFAAAGITKAPATWAEVAADGKKLTGNGHWGLAEEGGNVVENVHNVFVLAKQRGSDFFDSSGNPTFTTPRNVAAVKQYVDFMAADKIVSPDSAEYDQNQSVEDFAKGKTAMLLWQTAAATLTAHGMKPGDWGIAPIPVLTGTPGPGTVDSMAGGINIAIFKNTHNMDGATKFVKFMTSDTEQRILNHAYSSIPPTIAAQSAPEFNTPDLKVLRKVLTYSSAPLPQVPAESQFETTVGGAIKALFADAAAGRPVTTASVKARLSAAQQQMQK